MKPRKPRWPIALLLAAGCFRSAAPKPVAPAAPSDATIEQTVSGGRWQTSATAAGNYRVAIRREKSEGSETIRRYAVLEWIQDGGDGLAVGRAVNLNDLAHVYALNDPVIVRRGANWVLDLRAAKVRLDDYDTGVEFVLGDPGTVTLVRSPSPTLR